MRGKVHRVAIRPPRSPRDPQAGGLAVGLTVRTGDGGSAGTRGAPIPRLCAEGSRFLDPRNPGMVTRAAARTGPGPPLRPGFLNST